MFPSHIALSLHSVNDVLYSGHGRTHFNKPANGRFRDKLKSSREKYKESVDKNTFCKSIMEEWKSQDPSGRFLKQDADTKKWFEIEPTMMTRKIRQSFDNLNQRK
jgi:hypothetical protein